MKILSDLRMGFVLALSVALIGFLFRLGWSLAGAWLFRIGIVDAAHRTEIHNNGGTIQLQTKENR